jgi:hypothetical protein
MFCFSLPDFNKIISWIHRRDPERLQHEAFNVSNKKDQIEMFSMAFHMQIIMN